MLTQRKIKSVAPRSTIEVHLPNDQVLEGPRGATIGEFLGTLNAYPPIVGAIVNSELRELSHQVEMDALVRPVSMDEADGMRIYRRSLTFLLTTAFEQLFPDDILLIDHSVSSGGYFCQVTSRPPLSESDLQELEERMRSIVAKDTPLRRFEVPLADAIEFFKSKGYDDKVRLLTHRNKDYLTLYQLEDNRDYHHGYMVPSSGYIQWFNLVLTGEGFTLRFPRRHRPTELLPLPDYPKLLTTFRQYRNWLWRLGIHSAGALADSIKNGRSREVILVSEALHERRISDIASQVVKRAGQIRIILVAGPSSSGKTTFAKRLSIQLLAYGVSPFPLEMDNYFLNRENTPLDENGEYDFESIAALDRQRLVEDLKGLTSGHTVQLSKFNFKTGKREVGDIVQLEPYQEYSDVMFNSALVYELSVLKPLAEPLVRQVPFGSREYVEAKRLLAYLEWFLPLQSEWIPDNSILREFIGNSILRDLTLWYRQPGK